MSRPHEQVGDVVSKIPPELNTSAPVAWAFMTANGSVWDFTSVPDVAARWALNHGEDKVVALYLAPSAAGVTVTEGEGMLAVGLELIRLHKELTEEREAVASFIAQNRALRHRAERAERVVEAAKRFDSAWDVASVTDEGLGLPPLLRCVPEARSLCEAVRALDAAQGDG